MQLVSSCYNYCAGQRSLSSQRQGFCHPIGATPLSSDVSGLVICFQVICVEWIKVVFKDHLPQNYPEFPTFKFMGLPCGTGSLGTWKSTFLKSLLRWRLTVLPRLSCNSSDPSASASGVVGTTGVHHHAGLWNLHSSTTLPCLQHSVTEVHYLHFARENIEATWLAWAQITSTWAQSRAQTIKFWKVHLFTLSAFII
jgi:hypothetical protein